MADKTLMSGNEAIARSALDAGCAFYAGYPITPQNELIAYMAAHMPRNRGVFVQAESEIAAINMVFGASSAGARAMTSSSGPGMSLKQEGISYLAGARLPAVIVNIMRGGPGLGNIAPAQSDYFQAVRGGGHGDYHCIVFAPASVQEAYDCTREAFDLAGRYRMPVIVLGDGILGQMMEPVIVHTVHDMVHSRQSTVHKRKRLWTVDCGRWTTPWALTGCAGRQPRVVKSFYLREGELEKSNLILQKTYAKIQKRHQRHEGIYLDDARVVLCAYGSMSRIARNAAYKLRGEGLKVGLFRPVTVWPFPAGAIRRLARVSANRIGLVLEMSYGQMVDDVRLAVNGVFPVEFMGRAGGGIPSEREIVRRVRRLYLKLS